MWSRAIILVDMNAFFASVEQLDHPEWRGRALAVTNGKLGSCIITCSYEARAFGIKTGMRLYEAKKRCPDLIQVPANPRRYSQVSSAIMAALEKVTPDIEIFSVDEAFLDVTKCQLLHGTPEQIAKMVKNIVYEASGLLCSVGVSGDKTTAKFAAKLQKPDGLTVIPPDEAGRRLAYVPVTELCGIKRGIGDFLAKHGVFVCGDMKSVPISILARRFGNLGRRIWYMCQGADPDPVHTKIASPKSMGHGKVMPPNTTDWVVIKTYLMHMSELLASRLRQHQFYAQRFFVAVRSREEGWLGGVSHAVQPTQDGSDIVQLGVMILSQSWFGQPVCQIQVTALDPNPSGLQLDLFIKPNHKKEDLLDVIDDINAKFGDFTIAPVPLMSRSSMPKVIAPAWKPKGHRQTI